MSVNTQRAFPFWPPSTEKYRVKRTSGPGLLSDLEASYRGAGMSKLEYGALLVAAGTLPAQSTPAAIVDLAEEVLAEVATRS